MLTYKTLAILATAIFYASTCFSQQIETGNFNDWDFGPSKVFGNLRLSKTSERKFIRISKISDSIAKVESINPSAIATNTVTLTFKNGMISHIEKTSQFGDIYSRQRFNLVDSNTFIVTEQVNGVNNFLPCKSAKYIYHNGMLKEEQYLSFRGTLTENKNGVAIIRYERYDDNIRFADTREMSFFDAQGKPVKSKNLDFHKVVYTWDEQDNKVSEFYCGNNDEPTVIRQSKMASQLYTYDSNNNRIKYEIHALDGSIMNGYSGVAIGESIFEKSYEVAGIRYDKQHHITRASASTDSIAIIKTEYDQFGNQIKQGYFDANGDPITDQDGIHKYVDTYSPDNMLIKESYFNEFERPGLNRDGFHEIVYASDKLGRLISKEGFGLNGEPVLNYTDKVYMLKYRYDDSNRRYSTSYWKDSITQMPRWNGTYEQITLFNEDGQNAGFEYLNMKGKPFRSADSSSGTKLVYNDDGKLSQRNFFFDGKPVMRSQGVTSGYSSIHYAQDDRGRVSELTFFDAQGDSVNANISIHEDFLTHRIILIYKGNRIVEELFYTIGNPVPVQDIDCLENDYIDVTGVGTGRKNVH